MTDRGFFGSYVAALAALVLAACSPHSPSALMPGAPFAPDLQHARAPHWKSTSIGTFSDPYGVAVNPACSANCGVYVADPGAKTVWKVEPDGRRTSILDSSVAGPGFDPQAVAVSQDDVAWVADKRPIGQKSIIWFVHPGAVGVAAGGFIFPAQTYARGIAVGTDGEVYVAAATFLPLTQKGEVICQGSNCKFPRQEFGNPYGVAIDARKAVYVADAGRQAVWWQAAGTRGFNRLYNVGELGDPYDVAVNSAGNLVAVADPGNQRVWAIHNSARIDLGYFTDPYGVAVDRSENVYVADPGSKNVWKLTP